MERIIHIYIVFFGEMCFALQNVKLQTRLRNGLNLYDEGPLYIGFAKEEKKAFHDLFI